MNEPSDTGMEDMDERVDRVQSALFELGTAWARYGLSAGRMALETSARSMNAAADLLAVLSETIERQPERTSEEQDPGDDEVARTVDTTGEPGAE